jgi:hypothetical protein
MNCFSGFRLDTFIMAPYHFIAMETITPSAAGPGGVLYRMKGDNAWDSLSSSSALGFDLFRWPPLWDLGGYQNRFPYRGKDLLVQWKFFSGA